MCPRAIRAGTGAARCRGSTAGGPRQPEPPPLPPPPGIHASRRPASARVLRAGLDAHAARVRAAPPHAGVHAAGRVHGHGEPAGPRLVLRALALLALGGGGGGRAHPGVVHEVGQDAHLVARAAGRLVDEGLREALAACECSGVGVEEEDGQVCVWGGGWGCA